MCDKIIKFPLCAKLQLLCQLLSGGEGGRGEKRSQDTCGLTAVNMERKRENIFTLCVHSMVVPWIIKVIQRFLNIHTLLML